MGRKFCRWDLLRRDDVEMKRRLAMNVNTATIKWLIFLLLLPFLSYGQTKKETEEWLDYYLNKYFSNYTLGAPTSMGMRYSGSYFFKDGLLYHHYDTYTKKNQYSFTQDSLLWSQTDIIHFNRVHKIHFENNTDELLGFRVSVTMDFYITSDTTVEAYNGEGKSMNALNGNVYVFVSTDDAVLKDNLLDRIKKALEHYSALSGAKLLKEVF